MLTNAEIQEIRERWDGDIDEQAHSLCRWDIRRLLEHVEELARRIHPLFVVKPMDDATISRLHALLGVTGQGYDGALPMIVLPERAPANIQNDTPKQGPVAKSPEDDGA